ncbi:MAG: hypothetical protein LBI14_09330 [Treponema sp.]|jgi:hypothetical protein|nr:hypothetical protein [Treponema sp.]
MQDSKGFCGAFEPSRCVGSKAQTGMEAGLAKTPAWKEQTGSLRLEGESCPC